MIKVTPLFSSSLGNCYMVDSGNSRLLLECGIPWKKIKQALNFQTSTIDGCLASHPHGDHIKAAKDLTKAGIDLYTSKETCEAIGLTGHRVHHIEAGTLFRIKTWNIMPFETVHLNNDGLPCLGSLGFLIASGAEKLLFLTDSAYCRYKFNGLTQIMVEANFSNEILDRNVANGSISKSRKQRLLDSHFSLDRVVEFLQKNDLSKLQTIYLMHLSEKNSDEALFKRTIQQIVGVPVHICGV